MGKYRKFFFSFIALVIKNPSPLQDHLNIYFYFLAGI